MLNILIDLLDLHCYVDGRNEIWRFFCMVLFKRCLQSYCWNYSHILNLLFSGDISFFFEFGIENFNSMLVKFKMIVRLYLQSRDDILLLFFLFKTFVSCTDVPKLLKNYNLVPKHFFFLNTNHQATRIIVNK